jgi:hypothetical protein
MKVEREIKQLIKTGHSDAYIGAVIYGKYAYKYNVKQIDDLINKYKNK